MQVLYRFEFHPKCIRKTLGLSSDKVGTGVGMT